MIGARLPLALEQGGLAVPEGRIAVFHPVADADLSALPINDCDVIQPFRPVYDAFVARGFNANVTPDGRYSMAVVCLPRAKAEARTIIAMAAACTDGPIIVDGQKTDGVDSLFKDLKKRADVSGAISKAHGKLFWIKSHDGLVDWAQGPALTDGGFWTAPGVFSADGIDPASALLVDAMPAKFGKNVADLGAGWGFLTAHILTRDVNVVHMVEAGHMALECAKRNVTDERVKYHWADATTWKPKDRIDTVVMNPPFHTGRAAEPSLGQAFVSAAARILAPSGQLWMVANRHLPYEDALAANFAKVVDLGGDNRFKLFNAARPLRKRS
ncbi:MAG: class I SAM-dependent methyltransferase [Ascidiaceihabitans sp.]|nr:class I SAM-dependent methyltransferase [Ascidiaceihabitans sp.]